MPDYFTPKDIRKIKRNTNINNHGENYVFIAHKIHSLLEQQFKAINREHDRIGYLPQELSVKRYNLYNKLMSELEKKSPNEYEAVCGSL